MYIFQNMCSGKCTAWSCAYVCAFFVFDCVSYSPWDQPQRITLALFDPDTSMIQHPSENVFPHQASLLCSQLHEVTQTQLI